MLLVAVHIDSLHALCEFCLFPRRLVTARCLLQPAVDPGLVVSYRRCLGRNMLVNDGVR